MSAVEQDLDFILEKTEQLFTIVENEKYHLLETKELVRAQLIKQFYSNYSPEEIAGVGDKFEQLVKRSSELTTICEAIFQATKEDMLKLKKSSKIKKAYK